VRTTQRQADGNLKTLPSARAWRRLSVGYGARGVRAATVTRLTKQWQDDHAFQDRDLSDRDHM